MYYLYSYYTIFCILFNSITQLFRLHLYNLQMLSCIYFCNRTISVIMFTNLNTKLTSPY